MNKFINAAQVKWVCHHLHLDKSKTITHDILEQSLTHMKEKWYLMREVKRGYTEKDLYTRMNASIDLLHQQNCHMMKTFIDIDSVVGMRPMNVALELKRKWWEENRVDIRIGTQPLDGLETDENIRLFKDACKVADFVGCLPSRDKVPERHLDIVFSTAQQENKHVEAHLDQCNIPSEKETEMFCDFVEKYKYQGRARAVHCISLACHPEEYQNSIARRLHRNGIGVIICPSAALSMHQEAGMMAAIHNSIGPVKVFLANGVDVGMGVDNIEDIFMPFCDGNLAFELRLLAESTRIYNPEVLLQIATNEMGFKNETK